MSPSPHLLDRALVVAIAALLVARNIIGGSPSAYDSLDSGTAGIDLNALLLLVFIFFSISRGILQRRLIGWTLVGLCGLGVLAWITTAGILAPYGHPATRFVWDGILAAVLYFLVRQLAPIPALSDGLLIVILASVTSSAGLALAAPLGMNVVASIAQAPSQLLPLLIMMLPVAALLASYGWRGGGWNRLLVVIVGFWLVAAYFATVQHLPNRAERALGVETAIDLAQSRPWFGAGPAYFLPPAQRYVPATSDTPLTGTHNGYLALAATCGWPAVVGVLLVLGLFVRQTRHATDIPESDGDESIRWDLYIGGMIGLSLGFLLLVTDKPRLSGTQSLVDQAMIAGARALLWFGSLALWEAILLGRKAITNALVLGVALLAIAAAFTDAIVQPAVIQPLVVVIALAMNRTATIIATTAPPIRLVQRWWLIPLTVVLFFGFLLQVLFTATTTADAIHRVRARESLVDAERDWVGKVPVNARRSRAEKAEGLLVREILAPLAEAAKYDPYHAPLLRLFAEKSLQQWELNLDAASATRPAEAAHRRAIDDATQLTKFLQSLHDRIIATDPESVESYQGAFKTILTFTRQSKSHRADRLARAQELMLLAIERDPSVEADLRWQLLETRFAVADEDQQRQAVDDAIALLKFDHRAPSPRYRLTIAQRERLLERLNNPSPEVIEEWLRDK